MTDKQGNGFGPVYSSTGPVEMLPHVQKLYNGPEYWTKPYPFIITLKELMSLHRMNRPRAELPMAGRAIDIWQHQNRISH